MVQALAFAELLIGGILALAGYKGASISEVIQGTAPEKPNALSGKTTKQEEANVPNVEQGKQEGFERSPLTGEPVKEEAHTLPGQLGPGGLRASPFSPSPKVSGNLTWNELRKHIKAGTMTPNQVKEAIKKLEGK